MALEKHVGSPRRSGQVAPLLRDAQRSVSRALSARIVSHGVTIGQWYFLRALWEEDGLTQRELSQRVGMTEPTTVAALNGMERHGMVRRLRNTQDRRKINIFLTDKGRSLRRTLLEHEAEIDRLAVDGLSEADRGTLIRSLRSIIANLNRGDA